MFAQKQQQAGGNNGMWCSFCKKKHLIDCAECVLIKHQQQKQASASVQTENTPGAGQQQDPGQNKQKQGNDGTEGTDGATTGRQCFMASLQEEYESDESGCGIGLICTQLTSILTAAALTNASLTNKLILSHDLRCHLTMSQS